MESNEIWISVLYNNGKFVNVHFDSKWSNCKWIGTEFKPEDSKINLETLFHEFELEKLGWKLPFDKLCVPTAVWGQVYDNLIHYTIRKF